jgi:hypothetical protein
VFHRQLRQLALKPGPGFEPGWRPGDALRSMIVRCEGTKLFKIRDGSARVDGHAWILDQIRWGHAASRESSGVADAGQASGRISGGRRVDF